MMMFKYALKGHESVVYKSFNICAPFWEFWRPVFGKEQWRLKAELEGRLFLCIFFQFVTFAYKKTATKWSL